MSEHPLDLTTVRCKCSWCGTPIPLPPRDWDGRTAVYCLEHKIVAGRHPWSVGQEAILDAMEVQDRDPEQLIRWPFRDVHALAGVLVPKRVYYVAAFPGNGKTSFLSACYAAWVDAGFRVTYLPLESDPSETITRVACARAGVSADDALSMRLRLKAEEGDVVAIQQRDALAVAFRLLREDREFWEYFRIEPTASLTAKRFTAVVDAVKAMGSDILIVDHVDHVEYDEGEFGPEIAASNKIQQLALNAARSCDIPVVLATQLNSSKTQSDKLAHYRAPLMDWLYNKGKKEQIAAVCLGLYRPMDPHVDPDLMTAVKGGTQPPWKIAKPNRMAIAGMKLRFGGAMKDRSVELRYEHGVLSDLDGPELRDLMQPAPRPDPSLSGAPY